MAKFETGDIVKSVRDFTISNTDGSKELVVQKDNEYTVVTSFTDIDNCDLCLCDIGDFMQIFLASDLELVERVPQSKTKENEESDNIRTIDKKTFEALSRLGILNTNVRTYNCGNSDYSQHIIQPWSIWQDWNLNPWDADIVKRILRTKQGDSRILDYEKIIHICNERIRQLKEE